MDFKGTKNASTIEERCVVGASPQKVYIGCYIWCNISETTSCLVYELSKCKF